MPCWRFWGASDGQITFQHYACGDSATYVLSGEQNNAAWLFVDGVIQNGSSYQYWSGGQYSRGIEQVTDVTSREGVVSGSCDGCKGPQPPPPSARYDCVNGSCVEKERYSTPGIYESLSACEQNCGSGCAGVCISDTDWAKISSLVAMVRNKNCEKK